MNTSSQIQVRALLARQQLLHQQQHKRLVRKIHDEISQKMTLLALQLSLASSEKSAPENWAGSCKEWSGNLMELGQSVREIISELQPRILDEFGLPAALQWLAQFSARDIKCSIIESDEDIPLAPFAANELFGICREIVEDILVPAGVARAEIELRQDDGVVRLQVRAHNNGLGQQRMTEKDLNAIAAYERLDYLDGAVELDFLPDIGSTVTLSVPAGRAMACCAN